MFLRLVSRCERVLPVARRSSRGAAAGQLDTTVRLKYTLTVQPTLSSASSLAALLSPLGAIDSASIVLSIKPNKKNPSKPGKNVTAVVPFARIEGAFAAVTSSGLKEKGLEGVEVTWVNGEPELIGWLRAKGKLNVGAPKTSGSEGAFSSFPDDPFEVS